MQGDLMLVVGLIIAVLSVPALLNAWAESRKPRAGAIMVMIAIALIILAWRLKPGGYRLDELPNVFFSVIGQWI